MKEYGQILATNTANLGNLCNKVGEQNGKVVQLEKQISPLVEERKRRKWLNSQVVTSVFSIISSLLIIWLAWKIRGGV